MSEYDELKDHILTVFDSVNEWGKTTNRYADAVNDQVAKLWKDNAELRDELHALANRVEALTRARLTEPAEVAEAMVRKHGVPCSECGVPVYVDHLDPQLPSPIRNAADGAPHTCHA